MFVSRLDMIYLTPIDFAEFDMFNFYILEDAKVARHNYRGLGENRYNDNAFFSNSILIDGFIDNYCNINEYSHTVPKDRPQHPVDNQSIFYNYVHAVVCEDNVKIAFKMGVHSDLDIVRNIYRDRLELYNNIVEELKLEQSADVMFITHPSYLYIHGQWTIRTG